MTPLVLLFAAALQPSPAEPVRAEVCLAHINVMIADAMRESGRVAGPSWLIRDWWRERVPGDGQSGALAPEERTALEQAIIERRARDPEGHGVELGACVDEAIDAGAVPGMARVAPEQAPG